jgi:hypothetical protein
MTTDILEQVQQVAAREEAIMAEHTLLEAVGDDVDMQDMVRKLAPAFAKLTAQQAKKYSAMAEAEAASAKQAVGKINEEMETFRTSKTSAEQERAFTALEMALPDDVPEVSAMIKDDRFIAAYDGSFGETPFTIKEMAARYMQQGQPKKAAKLMADTWRSVAGGKQAPVATPKSIGSESTPAEEVKWAQNKEFHQARKSRGYVDI